MNSPTMRLLAIFTVIIIGAGVYAYAAFGRPQATPAAMQNQEEEKPLTVTEESPQATTTSVKIALLDYEGTSDGKSRGCDKVVLVTRTVPQTPAPLTAALKELFALNQTEVSGLHNFIPRTKATLSFDRATIADSVASIYLKGSLSGLAGVCDDPRAKAQIEETALQFPSVTSVKLYLNGIATELQPNESGM